MINRRVWLQGLAAGAAASSVGGATKVATEGGRAAWLRHLEKLAYPVLNHLAHGTLKRAMPVECAPSQEQDRKRYTHLEALARLLAGIAPWLELKLGASAERDAQQKYADLARAAITQAVDPGSPDYLNFAEGAQPLVDCGFLAQAVLRAPSALWSNLDGPMRQRLATALSASRAIRPGENNWLLFSAMVETALAAMGERWEAGPIERAISRHEEWYKGDGWYGDGPQFHWDYYNSYVIQPMLVDVLRGIDGHSAQWRNKLPGVIQRARRYAAIQERLIAADGSFPAIGRSICYRCGAFHLLAQVALLGELPKPLTGARVRCALSAVIRRTLDAPGTYDKAGWLQIGLCGHQPQLGETYISTGSLYLCATALLPLGLSPRDAFWTGATEDWTQRRVWAGEDSAADHAL